MSSSAEQQAEEVNFQRILGALRRRGVWALLCVVLAGGVAYAISKHQPKQYTATALLLFNNNQLSQQLAGLQTGAVGQAQPGSDLRLVQVGDMAEKTAYALGRGLTPAKVIDSLRIAQQGETNLVGESNVVEVASSEKDPGLASMIADTYAESFVVDQRRANRRYFSAALRIVERQLKGLSSKARHGTAGEALQSRAQSLKLLASLQYGGVELAQRASTPTSPSSPRTSRNTLIGALLGLLVGLGIVFLLERLDRRIRDPRELDGIYHVPVLGSVPQSISLSHPEQRFREAGAVPAPAELDTFDLILAHLRSFNASVHSVLITSAGAGDGKTTVALHLAEAAARTGSRTLLLEMDFRSPMLATRVVVAPHPGLVDVLDGVLAIGGAIQSVDLRAPNDGEDDAVTLDVLTCGIQEPSVPARLIQGPAMDMAWDQLSSEYDLIVVDAPVLTRVSDAFAILRKVDGVVIVARIGHGSRDTAEQLGEVLARSAVPLLGIVANRWPRKVRSSKPVPTAIASSRLERDRLPG